MAPPTADFAHALPRSRPLCGPRSSLVNGTPFAPSLRTMARTSTKTTARKKSKTGRPLAGLGRDTGATALPEAETALMRAVLEDAILCYLGRGRRRRIDPRILAREAEFWIRRDDWESPFSFNNVCGALGLSHCSARVEILAWKNGDANNQLASLAAVAAG
jgi:hypothetical protein